MTAPLTPSTSPAIDADHGAVVAPHLGDLRRAEVLVARLRHLELRRQVDPELEAAHAPVGAGPRHLLVHDAAAGRHPLHVAGADRAGVADAVAVVDLAGQHVGDGLDAAVRVPGEPRQVVVGVV